MTLSTSARCPGTERNSTARRDAAVERNIDSVLRSSRDLEARRFDRALAGTAPGVVYVSSLLPEPAVGRPEAKAALERLAAETGARFEARCALAYGRMVAVFLLGRGKDGRQLTSMVLNEFDDSGMRIQILESFDPGRGRGRALTTPSTAEKDRAERNVASVVAGIEAFDRRDFDTALADISPEIVYESTLFPCPIRGLGASRKALQELAARTGVHFQPASILATGEAVLVYLQGEDKEGAELTNMVLNRFDSSGQRDFITECLDPASRSPGSKCRAPARVSSPAPAILAAFPPGVDPVTYRLDVAQAALGRVVDLPLSAEPGPGTAAEPIVERGAEVGGKLSLSLRDDRAGGQGPSGSEVGSARLSWWTLPEGASPHPGGAITPIEVDPGTSQRLLVRGRADLGRNRGLDLYGTGRTSWPSGGAQVSGAVLEARGRSAWAGLEGLGALSALAPWHQATRFGLLLRLQEGGRRKHRRIPPPSGGMDLAAAGGDLYLQGRLDPGHPFAFDLEPGSGLVRARGHEQLRRVALAPECGIASGPICGIGVGEAVGAIDFEVFFQAFGREPPLPFQTRDAILRFHDPGGGEVGALRADIVEGRAFPFAVSGLPLPAFRMGGLAPIISGEGAFASARGIVVVESWLSVFPSFINSIFSLRLMR